jgi:hypothetical protein
MFFDSNYEVCKKDLSNLYQVFHKKVIVFVLALGLRRDKEIYQSASKRV